MNVSEIIDRILTEIPGSPFEETVDTLKAGSREQHVSRIAVTFLATYDVIRRAIDENCNFIITHEPTFYSHMDDLSGLQSDPVYIAKRKLIDENEVAIWRFHDYAHSHIPDLIVSGTEQKLGWAAFRSNPDESVYEISDTSLDELVQHVHSSLGEAPRRVIGVPQTSCSTVGLSVGSPGSDHHQHLIHAANPDVLICGELNEWETAIYAHDAQSLGMKPALVEIGHAVSEEAGMEYVGEWLEPLVPNIPVTFIPAGDPWNRNEDLKHISR